MAQPLLVLLSLLLTPGESGNNGLALTPPLTWRSWNSFGFHISAETMLTAARGLVDTSRPINKLPIGSSLLSLGFNSVGMDEGWAVCEPKPGFQPLNSMFHKTNPDGSVTPQINTTLFPDLKGLVETIHSMGLKAGWYLNPCFSYCWALGDVCNTQECFEGDVRVALTSGFDSVKLDGCSQLKNTTLFAALFNDSGVPILLEDCHDQNAPTVPISQGGCPDYHTYRSSTDIRNTYGSWLQNAYSVQPFTDGRTGPTCYAYPDMLMVGVEDTCAGDTCAGDEPPLPTLTEQRTHFGLWCILSSPLTLSMNFGGNVTLLDSVWPIITNVDALAVNQEWSGEAGGQVIGDTNPVKVTLQHCTPGWAQDLNCSVPITQAWYKPLPTQAFALFLVNNHPTQNNTASVHLSNLPGVECGLPSLPPCAVYDIWQQQEVAPVGLVGGVFTATLGPHDSAFVVLSTGPWGGGVEWLKQGTH